MAENINAEEDKKMMTRRRFITTVTERDDLTSPANTSLLNRGWLMKINSYYFFSALGYVTLRLGKPKKSFQLNLMGVQFTRTSCSISKEGNIT